MKKIFKSTLIAAFVTIGFMTCLPSCAGNENSDTTQEQKDATSVNIHANREVSDYTAYIDDGEGKMGLDHAYLSTALSKLAKAVESKSAQIGYTIGEDLGKVREYADRITHDQYATTHADDIRKAADILNASIINIQAAKYPQFVSEVDSLKTASAAIDPAVLTLDQKNAIQSYLSKAAELLQKMN